MASIIPWSTMILSPTMSTTPPPFGVQTYYPGWFWPVVISSVIVGAIILIIFIVILAVLCNNYFTYGYCCAPSVEKGSHNGRTTTRTSAHQTAVFENQTNKKPSKVTLKTKVTKQQLFVLPEASTANEIPGYGLNVDGVVIGARTVQTGSRGGRSGGPVKTRREFITADYDDTTSEVKGRERGNQPPPEIQIKRTGHNDQTAGDGGEDITVIVGNRRIVIPAQHPSHQAGQRSSTSTMQQVIVPQPTVPVHNQYQQYASTTTLPTYQQQLSPMPYHQQPMQLASSSSSYHQDSYFPAPPASTSSHPLDGGPHSAMIQVSRSGVDSIYPNLSGQSGTGYTNGGYYY